jgi:phosphatidylserine/phosphatidylglycerophosphate/cardiolipin synthase-like enzyme
MAGETLIGGSLEELEPPAAEWPRLDPLPNLRGPMGVTTFVSPDCSWAVLRDLFAAASRRLFVYIYNVSSPHMLGLLSDAVARGVDVRVMFDRTDTRGDEVEKLNALGALLRVAPSTGDRRAFTVCHQKFAVVDDATVVVESANWATTSIPKIDDPEGERWVKGNREWFVALDSRTAAALFTRLFELDWEWEPTAELVAAPELAARAGIPVPFEEVPPPRRFRPVRHEIDADVEIVPILSPQNYLDAVLPLIEGARRSICIEQQYIKARESDGPVARLVGAVSERHRAGVEVRIVSSAVFRSGWDATAASLARFGMKRRLRALNPTMFTHNHNKGIVIDEEIAVVSSTNWSDNSIAAAREAGLILRDRSVAGYFRNAFDLDWETGLPTRAVEQRFEELPPLAGPYLEIHPADLV